MAHFRHKLVNSTVDMYKHLTALERQVLFLEELYKQPLNSQKYQELMQIHFKRQEKESIN